MILDKIAETLSAMLYSILGLFPTWTFPFAGLGETIGSGVVTANAFFPMRTFAVCIGTVIGLQVAMWTWNLVVWAYSKIPFKFS